MLFNFCVVFVLIIISSEIVTSFGRSQKKQPCKKYTPKMPNYDMDNIRVSERKCKEYLWKMDEREQIKKNACKRNYFVIRGARTKPAEYPHMGALGWMTFNDSWIFLCGSSLISEKFVLTVAHCTKTKNVAVKHVHPKIVRLGVTDIYNSSNETPIDVDIKNIIRHPRYDPPKKYYDIALLELKTEVQFTKFIQPACLWSKPYNYPEKELTVTGWGAFDMITAFDILWLRYGICLNWNFILTFLRNISKTNIPEEEWVLVIQKHMHIEGNKFSHKLLYAKLDLFHPKRCDNSVLNNRNWWGTFNQQLCAGKADGSVDTCFGDSGGPLQFKLYETKKEGTMHMVIGITSFGSTKCAQKGIPAVYTNVATFINWIERHVWPEVRLRSSSLIIFRE